MIRRVVCTSLPSVLMALFLVLVLPACWYGAMSRAAVLGAEAPSSNNNNEEREEHDERDEHEVAALGTRPPPPARPPARFHRVVVIAPVTDTTTLQASVAAPIPVSQFSVRRLR